MNLKPLFASVALALAATLSLAAAPPTPAPAPPAPTATTHRIELPEPIALQIRRELASRVYE